MVKMSFIHLDFLFFFIVVVAVYWLLRARVWQNRFLALASFVFYGWIHPWLSALLLGVSLLNWIAAIGIERSKVRRGWILGATVTTSIVVLCTFKYFNWFVAAAAAHLPESVQILQIGLPLGLSFYTFHNLAYTIDVYRGKIAAQKNVIEYLLFAAYFPQLVAGPVERAGNMFPQFGRERVFNSALFRSGLTLALWGAFKKVAIADTISPHVDILFSHDPTTFGMVWAGALGFTIQALADFSGYTDIARGVSRMLGIELMDNFAHPYLAASPMEFWQRWHISFSTWLRDYVYLPSCFSPWIRRWVTIPFSGEWGPFAHTSRALFITMFVSGLWHGSTWNFVLWGMYHAVMATLYTGILQKIPRKIRKKRGWRLITVPLMFCVTVVGMYIFREPSLARLVSNLRLDPLGGTQEEWIVVVAMLGLCALAAVPLMVATLFERHVLPFIRKSTFVLPLQTTAWAAFAIAVFCSAKETSAAFIYFQF
jgi:alginate O-acetyltransferase complex protein AlgI